MKQYTVVNSETGYSKEFYSLPAAKEAMKAHNAKGYITKIWANGNWEPGGEIVLKGSNKTFFANTQQKKMSYN